MVHLLLAATASPTTPPSNDATFLFSCCDLLTLGITDVGGCHYARSYFEPRPETMVTGRRVFYPPYSVSNDMSPKNHSGRFCLRVRRISSFQALNGVGVPRWEAVGS